MEWTGYTTLTEDQRKFLTIVYTYTWKSNALYPFQTMIRKVLDGGRYKISDKVNLNAAGETFRQTYPNLKWREYKTLKSRGPDG